MRQAAEFLQSRRDRGCAPRTINRYADVVMPWTRARRRNKNGLVAFLSDIPNEQTRRHAFVVIRTFERFCGSTWQDKVCIRFAPPPHPHVLTADEAQRLIAAMPQPYSAIAATLYYTGARLNSVLCLHPDDIDLSAATVRLHAKGRVCADVCLPPPLMPTLQAHIAALPMGCPWLFPCPTHDTHAGGIGLRRAMREAAAAIGLTRRIYPHLLRHSCATELVNRGVPLECVQRQLLHRNISTTQIYAKIGLGRVSDAVRTAWQ